MEVKLEIIFKHAMKYHKKDVDFGFKEKTETEILKKIYEFESSKGTMIMAIYLIEKIGGVNIYASMLPIAILCNKIIIDSFSIFDHFDEVTDCVYVLKYFEFEKKFLAAIKWEVSMNRNLYVKYCMLLCV